MTTFGISVRSGFPAVGLPKAWAPFLLSAGLWAVLFALGAESLRVLSVLDL